MKKFLIYSSALIVLCAACVEAFAAPIDDTDTPAPMSTTSLPIAETITASSTVPSSTPTTTLRNPSSSSSANDDIDCDEAEELYDAGNNEDLADYCDYGPDGEWDTEDDYDSWEE